MSRATDRTSFMVGTGLLLGVLGSGPIGAIFGGVLLGGLLHELYDPKPNLPGRMSSYVVDTFPSTRVVFGYHSRPWYQRPMFGLSSLFGGDVRHTSNVRPCSTLSRTSSYTRPASTYTSTSSSSWLPSWGSGSYSSYSSSGSSSHVPSNATLTSSYVRPR